MSWLFSRALVEEYLGADCLDGAPFVPSSKTLMPQAYLWHVKTTDAWRHSPSGMTFAPLTDDHGEAMLMSYLEDFPAKTLAPQEKALESPENAADFGEKWRELSARCDPTTSLWKTHQCLFPEVLPSSSVILPRWGMMQNGVCLELTTLELHTNVTESGSWLPTPTATANMLAPSMQKWASHQELYEQVGGSLNPAWVEWLMGWPIGWTDLEPLEMDKFQSWLQAHSNCFDE